MRVLIAAFAVLIAPLASAEETGERVIASLSQNAVGITSTFTGSEIFLYGAVERGRLSDARDDDIAVIVTVSGPRQPMTVRRKSRAFGIWINTTSVEIDEAPSFYAVASSAPLDEILSHTEDLRHRITVEKAVRVVGEARASASPDAFHDAAIRLSRAAGVYFESVGDVSIIGRTLFQTHIELPSNIIEGDYVARVFLLRNRAVIDKFTTRIVVSKVGFERWIYALAHEQSLIYGILSILVALFAGWGASEAFRLLRR
ncbi:MAG: TIGR02186 family protein [Paracoccaceae bacterium]